MKKIFHVFLFLPNYIKKKHTKTISITDAAPWIQDHGQHDVFANLKHV